MLELRDAAERANCRIKEWKLTEPEGRRLAGEMEAVTLTSADAIFESMKNYGAHIFGARIRLL